MNYVNTTGLVSYWRLDGDVTDSVGGNDGTNSGSNDTVGIVGHGRYFDANNRDITFPAAGTTDLVNWSFSSWIKADNANLNLILPIGKEGSEWITRSPGTTNRVRTDGS